MNTTGKSDLIKQLAATHNLKVIDIRLAQCDPSDLAGFPTVNKETGRAHYTPMNIFPLDGDPLPKDENGVEMNGWLIFLDELPSAPLAVQKSAYRLLLDKQVGQHDLHKNVAMVAAGNLSTDNALVSQLSTATQSRLIHFELMANIKEWTKWANENQVDHRIIAYLNFRPDMLHNFKPDHTDSTFPCPRTWHFLSKMSSGIPVLSSADLPFIAGTIGEGAAREFLSYTQIYKELLTIEEIMANPQGVKISNEPSVRWAISGMVASNFEVENAPILMKFITRLPVEFLTITIQAAIQRNSAILETPAVDDWINNNLDLFS